VSARPRERSGEARQSAKGAAAADRPAVVVDIEELNAAGDGVARLGGRPLIVPFTIPGERVSVRTTAPRGGVMYGVLDAVIAASPHRIAPYCPHFGPAAEPGVGPCGGCSWQHIAYPEQLRLKTELVTRLVRQAEPSAPPAQPMLPGAPIEYPWGYRHKVHFVFGTEGRAGRRESTLVMGHYVRGSRRIIPVRECPVHDERGNALAFNFRNAFARTNAVAAPQEGKRPALKSIAVRVGHGTPEVMATLVLTSEADKALRTASRRVLDEAGAPTSFHVNLHPEEDGFIFGRDTRKVSGPERMREKVADASFLVSPTAFFQTNIHAAAILVRLVFAAVPDGARVLDLYAGAGLFAIPLARAGHRVVAVEESRAAVADGEASLRLNRLPDGAIRFIPRRVEEALATAAVRPPFDVVVLDPPREGCSAEVIDRVFGDVSPDKAVYISCNPEALARDLAEITTHGYAVESIQPVDMFPHTAHIEAVVVLTRNAPIKRRPTRP
jgi:23S rRNA (uracil1939-C5)-methyltransferase